MTLQSGKPRATWTIAEAKSRLSEIRRLAKSEGPQRIDVERSSFVIAECDGETAQQPLELDGDTTLGQWLVENLRGLGPLYRPFELDSGRLIPFLDYTEDELEELEQREQAAE